MPVRDGDKRAIKDSFRHPEDSRRSCIPTLRPIFLKMGIKSFIRCPWGRTGGRKPKLTSEQIEMAKGLLASGKAPRDVAKAFGVGRSTLYRYVPGDTSTADEEVVQP